MQEQERTISVPVTTYEISVSREPIAEGTQAEASFDEGSMDLPVMGGEPTIEKSVVVREQLRIQARPTTEQRQLNATVRSEFADVTPEGDLNISGDVNELKDEAAPSQKSEEQMKQEQMKQEQQHQQELQQQYQEE